MNNAWNKVIYKIGSPVYDRFFNTGIFLDARKQVFQFIPFEKGQKVLFVGVGTGADLELIENSDFEVTAIDYSADMLSKAKRKFADSAIRFLEMDAQKMNFEDDSFDYVIASLTLSVVPNAGQSLSEFIRVLKPGGKVIIFDKFTPQHKQLSLPKKIARPIISLLGTDIGRSFEEIMDQSGSNCQVEEDSPVMMQGMYRKIIVAKRTQHR